MSRVRISPYDQEVDPEQQKRVPELHCARQGCACEVLADLGSGMDDSERRLETPLDGIVAGEVGRPVIARRVGCSAPVPCWSSRPAPRGEARSPSRWTAPSGSSGARSPTRRG